MVVPLESTEPDCSPPNLPAEGDWFEGGKGRFSAGHRDRLEITAKRDTDLTLWFSAWGFGGQRGGEITLGQENKRTTFRV